MSMPYSSAPRRKVRNSPPAAAAARAASWRATCVASLIMFIVDLLPFGTRSDGLSAGDGENLKSGRSLQLEHADQLRQLDRLLLQRLRRGGAFLDQRGVLLRHLVELRDRAVDLADAV